MALQEAILRLNYSINKIKKSILIILIIGIALFFKVYYLKDLNKI